MAMANDEHADGDEPQPFYAQEAGPPKTTVTFRTTDTPGALESALRLFWKRDINMTRIESLPCQDSSQAYKFLVDVEGKEEDDRIQALLQDYESPYDIWIEQTCVEIKL